MADGEDRDEDRPILGENEETKAARKRKIAVAVTIIAILLVLGIVVVVLVTTAYVQSKDKLEGGVPSEDLDKNNKTGVPSEDLDEDNKAVVTSEYFTLKGLYSVGLGTTSKFHGNSLPLHCI